MSRTSLADRVLPRQFRRELDEILQQHNRKVHSKLKVIPRDCSTKTRQERAGNLGRTFAELYELGYRLQSPTALKQKHIHALGRHWQEKGLAPKTLHGLFSNLREFARWVGKTDMVEDISVYCDGREHLVRKTAATVDLSWESRGVDVIAFIEGARRLNERLGCLLDFQRFFGLRTKESIELRPWRATALGGDFLYVTDGTKGGKPRMIPIRTERQRQIITAAQLLVGERINTQLRWPGKNWKQAQSYFYAQMRKLGATREQLGVSPHGLRHGFLQDEYQYFAGLPAPIKGGGKLPETRHEHKLALVAVSLEAGHFRESATGMYCGTLGHQLRPRNDATAVDSTPDSLNNEMEKQQ